MQQREDKPTFSSSSENAKTYEIDSLKVQQIQRKIKEDQNLLAGILAGGIAAAVSAVIWAAITVATDYQISWMAIGVGFLVGMAVRWAGKGVDKVFGVTGAVLALLSCFAGNLLTSAIVISQEEAMSLLEVLFIMLRSPTVILEIIQATFAPMDLLFYGLALYMGYKGSFRQITQQQMQAMLNEGSPY